MIVIHDVIHSLHFVNDAGDLLIGLGDHLYKMPHSACKSKKNYKHLLCFFYLN